MQETKLEGSGALCVAQTLKVHGIDRVYGVCGDHINSLYAALHHVGIELIGMRTESGAVQMADGYARASGHPAVAMVTGGPGHTNAITGMAVAHAAGSPVIVISGLTPVQYLHRGGQQVMEQARIAAPVTKQARELLHVDHLEEDIAQAFRTATSGTPGPVSLSIPVDVLNQQQSSPGRKPRALPFLQSGPSGTLSGSVLRHAKDMLRTAKRPVVILGSQAWGANIPSGFIPALEQWQVPIFTIEQSMGLVPDDGQTGFGYADPFFNATFRELGNADLVILAGGQIDFHTCFGGPQLLHPDVRILQIHPDPSRLGMCIPSELAVCGDATEALLQLAGERPLNPEALHWIRHLRATHQGKSGFWRKMLEELPTEPDSVHPLALCTALSRHITPRTGIVIDAGDFVHWPRAFFSAHTAGHWMDGSLMGNLGGSLPLAMGMQQAFPEDPVWAFVGDGGFGFYAWELATAVERQLPVKVILGNDRAWGIEKRLQQAEHGHDIGCDLPYARYDHFAETVGANGFYLNDPAALDETVAAFVASTGPALLNVDIPRLASRPLLDFQRY